MSELNASLASSINTDMPIESLQSSTILDFIAVNKSKYELLLNKMQAKDAALRKTVLSWCWPMVFLPFAPVWFFYRKMWIWGVALMAAIPVAYFYAPNFIVPFMLILALCAKSAYVTHAAKVVGSLEKRFQNRDQLQVEIAKRGGVSFPAACAGAVIMAIMTAMASYLLYQAGAFDGAF